MNEAELRKRLDNERAKLSHVQDIARALSSSLDLDQLLGLIMEKVRELMRADRATLFLVSDDRQELWSKVLEGGETQEIRLGVGEGIAGWVAVSGEVVNISDAYSDDRFNPGVDLTSGYRTRSILCVPMRDSTGAITGVLQVLNKEYGPFTLEDEELLAALSSQAAVSIENSRLYQSVVRKNVALLEAQEALEARTNELNVLYEIEQELVGALDLDSLLHRILHRAMNVVPSSAGSIALLEQDGPTLKLRYRTTAGAAARELRHLAIGANEGVIGWAAMRREGVLVNNPTEDSRHAKMLGGRVEFSPRNLVCAPLVDGETVLGTVELLNKVDGEDYTNRDLRMLTLIGGQASRAIKVTRSKQAVEEQNRLAAIGQMLAGVLHDLKTPMTIISGYAQLMAQMDEEEQRQSFVEQILQQFDLLNGMTREVLAFARGESTVLIRRVYLHLFLEQVREQLTHAHHSSPMSIEISADYDGAASFDQGAMLRLIHNLARNAAVAMGDTPGTFRISTSRSGNTLCFDFADTGPGIPAELEGQLFDRFVSASEGGSGLGLAICKKIVEDHKGEISYDSVLGKGTTFHVRLPCEPEA